METWRPSYPTLYRLVSSSSNVFLHTIKYNFDFSFFSKNWLFFLFKNTAFVQDLDFYEFPKLPEGTALPTTKSSNKICTMVRISLFYETGTKPSPKIYTERPVRVETRCAQNIFSATFDDILILKYIGINTDIPILTH